MNKEQLLQELITERKRIDDLIKRYETPASTIKFSDLLDSAQNSEDNDYESEDNECVYRERVITKTVTITNINNDYRHIENHVHTQHTNTNLSIGDSALSAFGGILHNFLEL